MQHPGTRLTSPHSLPGESLKTRAVNVSCFTSTNRGCALKAWALWGLPCAVALQGYTPICHSPTCSINRTPKYLPVIFGVVFTRLISLKFYPTGRGVCRTEGGYLGDMSTVGCDSPEVPTVPSRDLYYIPYKRAQQGGAFKDLSRKARRRSISSE